MRKRDNGRCFTCGKKDEWKRQHAGHFLHRAKTSPLAYNERLLRCQCPQCNTFNHGNLAKYALKMVKLYGYEQVNKWSQEANKTKHWNMGELNELIAHYQKKLNEIKS